MRLGIAKDSILSKPNWRQLVILGTVVSIAGGVLVTRNFKSQPDVTKAPQVEIPQIKTVTALGRIEPKGEVIKVSAPASTQGSRLENLLVQEGEKVKAGQVIAVLDNRDKLQAAYQKAKEAVLVSQANLAKVKAGAKVGEIDAQKSEIARVQAQSLGEERAQRETVARLEAQWEGDKAAQQATVRRLEAELSNASAELNRYYQLYSYGAISQSMYDSKRLPTQTLTQQLSEAKANLERTTRTGRKQIQEAKVVLARIKSTSSKQVSSAQATLEKIAEVRPVDVMAANAEVRQAVAAKKEAKANYEQAYIKAPQDGVIFKINSRAGEKVSDNGVVELGQVSQMRVVAEVYQTNIRKVKLGQNVRISSNSLGSELQGKVNWIGWQVQRQNIINSDPSENIDSRVIEVHIQLDEKSSQEAAKFTNLQVKAAIEL
ncbi:devB secretion protein [Dulcicalothrix desertica PCC 7102]|uniref:DevB secretion protein n=1 Tax=Dulcicalothrix desertica PCC 7102 TaxID=232991 RepID=A0A433V9Q2_9CYAN|nr:HlyD family efflux transporter periplasmic adaptor subunit [Dulcicalothrix desertica]RUT02831.1 devB secretion protein [Dulcicalothrix desertica PCC 7102]TWH38936.1 HlyD family secretion protein [Dulcicalothrix desertica PCC 7102]